MSDTARQRFFKFVQLVRDGALDEADHALGAALRTTPKDPNLLHLAAQVAERRGEITRAISLYRRALSVHANWMEATLNLARLLFSSRQPKEREESIQMLLAMTRLYPDRPEIWETLARFSQSAGHLIEATNAWRKALTLRPDNLEGRGQYLFACRQLCDWSETPEPDDSLPPHIAVLLFDDPDVQKKAAQNHVVRRLSGIPALPPPAKQTHERLRIGYLSSDFHAHATSYLMAELFELHNRSRTEVFAYSYGIDDHSPIRDRLKKGADHFIDLATLTPRACAEKIRTDEIDVLVDLKGHTTGGRLDILAHRPCALQIHWLGFPGTTGAPFIDAFVADSITVPDGAEASFTETIWRMPDTYQINDRHRLIGRPLERIAYGLPASGIVLASFNQSYKITRELFEIWCKLLLEEPGSTLWLLDTNPEATANLRQMATDLNVDPSRIVFAPPLPLEQHLARYNHVDLALDTFPIGGHTTTSDALWAGVPVVTRAGKSFIARVAASLLTAAQLPELITDSFENYGSLAQNLIKDEPRRKELRSRLQTNRLHLPLFDTPRFVEAWENLLIAHA